MLDCYCYTLAVTEYLCAMTYDLTDWKVKYFVCFPLKQFYTFSLSLLYNIFNFPILMFDVWFCFIVLR